MQTSKYIIFLDIKGKHNFNFLFVCYIHIVEIPTNSRAYYYKHKKIDNRELPATITMAMHIAHCSYDIRVRVQLSRQRTSIMLS